MNKSYKYFNISFMFSSLCGPEDGLVGNV